MGKNIGKLIIIIGLFLFANKTVTAFPLRHKFQALSYSLHTVNQYNKINDKDTSIFKVTNSRQQNLLAFDNNNTINISSKSLKLILKEESEDYFTLSVKIKNKVILTKKHLSGVSQVLIEGNYLLFSALTYTDDDANNQGYGHIIDLTSNQASFFKKKLTNTCNPVFINNSFYFINGLSLIKTGINFKIQKKIDITCLSKDKDNTYLDTYLISGLSTMANSQLTINFTPTKFKSRYKPYSGNVNASLSIIVLK